MKTHPCSHGRRLVGFTLIELLVVIGIIAILAGILLPTLSHMKTKAKIKLAAMDMKNLTAAIKQYEQEYSRMPVSKQAIESALNNPDCADFTYGTVNAAGTLIDQDVLDVKSYKDSGDPPYANSNGELMSILQTIGAAGANLTLKNLSSTFNPRQIAFFQPKHVEETERHGVDPAGDFYDPWGNPYVVTLDLNDDNLCVDGFYGHIRKFGKPKQSAGIKESVTIWSFGPDGKASKTDSTGQSIGPKDGANKDNVVSWE